ncbi:hypothetical protein [Streptomyces oceani]|uniref:hypothetical protein n=1 Tax=Streptomyces oceani TaxID=1075402 RepID=UPI001112EA2D|nr:hypothetical protein [Streptomyces oceani]
MEISVNPPYGVPPLYIGMSYADTVDAAAEFGELRVSGPFSHSPTVKVSASYKTLDVMALLEDGERVTAIELWRFEGCEQDIKVTCGGLDIFRTPAREFLDKKKEEGYRVDVSDPESPVIPGVTLAFTRETGQDVPLDPVDGLPLYFTSVLVSNEEYFD